MAVSDSLRMPTYGEVDELVDRSRPRREVMDWTDGPLWTDAPRRRQSGSHASEARSRALHPHRAQEPHRARQTHPDHALQTHPDHALQTHPDHEVLRTHEPEHLVLEPHRAPGLRSADTAGAPAAGNDARRTVVIRGRGAERYPAPRRGSESRLRPHERSGFKPDRVAMWAVLLGLALLLGAVTSAHAAVLHGVAAHLAAH